jgi:hypothetical protein
MAGTAWVRISFYTFSINGHFVTHISLRWKAKDFELNVGLEIEQDGHD